MGLSNKNSEQDDYEVSEESNNSESPDSRINSIIQWINNFYPNFSELNGKVEELNSLIKENQENISKIDKDFQLSSEISSSFDKEKIKSNLKIFEAKLKKCVFEIEQHNKLLNNLSENFKKLEEKSSQKKIFPVVQNAPENSLNSKFKKIDFALGEIKNFREELNEISEKTEKYSVISEKNKQDINKLSNLLRKEINDVKDYEKQFSFMLKDIKSFVTDINKSQFKKISGDEKINNENSDDENTAEEISESEADSRDLNEADTISDDSKIENDPLSSENIDGSIESFGSDEISDEISEDENLDLNGDLEESVRRESKGIFGKLKDTFTKK